MARATASATLRLLGGVSLSDASGAPVAISARKNAALLAYLAMAPGTTFSRDHLASLFWEDRGQEQARGSLRTALSTLRSLLGAQSIITEGDRVTLVTDVLQVDVARLRDEVRPLAPATGARGSRTDLAGRQGAGRVQRSSAFIWKIGTCGS